VPPAWQFKGAGALPSGSAGGSISASQGHDIPALDARVIVPSAILASSVSTGRRVNSQLEQRQIRGKIITTDRFLALIVADFWRRRLGLVAASGLLACPTARDRVRFGRMIGERERGGATTVVAPAEVLASDLEQEFGNRVRPKLPKRFNMAPQRKFA
jgi:hypothetical protein